MPQAQVKVTPMRDLFPYTQDQLAAYLEYQRTGRPTTLKHFDHPVGEIDFTKEDRAKIQEARKFRSDVLSKGPAKAAILAEIRHKKHVVTGHRFNVLGNKQTLRLTDTSIEVPKKAKLTLVKPAKVKAPKVKAAKPAAPAAEAQAPAPAIA